MRSISRFSIMFAGVALIAACGDQPSSSDASSKSNGTADGKFELVVYSARKPKFVEPVLAKFKQKTGISVRLHNAKASSLVKRLSIEGRRTNADVFLSNDAGTLQVGADKGLFHPVSEKLTENVPKALHAADRSWVGLSARARVIVVNTQTAETAAISNYADLAAPALKGKLGITSAANESFISGATVMLQTDGATKTLDWLKGLKANADGKAYAKHRHIVAAVASGEKSVGLVNHYYVYRHLDKAPNAPIKMIFPDQAGHGLALNSSGAAIVKHSKHKEAAEALIAFFLSAEGQAVFAGVNREFPVNKQVKAKAPVKALSNYKVADVPLAILGQRRLAMVQLIEKAQLP